MMDRQRHDIFPLIEYGILRRDFDMAAHDHFLNYTKDNSGIMHATQHQRPIEQI
jgi:hypothetical protein